MDLEAALEIKVNDPKILYRLGRAFYADKQFKECIKQMKLALLNHPYVSYEPDIYYHIALAYCQLDRYEKAIFPFSRSIDLIPSNFKYFHERAKAY